jgi:hypothetical protein
MHATLPLALLAALLALIWYLGTGKFGRSQTQAWIDRVRDYPRLFAFLNKHHGKFRAAGHYFEFGGLFLVLYWLQDTLTADHRLAFHPWRTLVVSGICAMVALLDELHQLSSGGRQFRRVDFLHSCCGIALAALIIQYQALYRGL